MRSRSLIALSVLAAATLSAAQAFADGWVHVTVNVKVTNPQPNTPAPAPVEYYLNDAQRMAAIISTENGDKGIQFLAPDQGYMDTFSSKRNEILHSELTRTAILPQDNALPNTLDKALKGAYALLETDRPQDIPGKQGQNETHVLTAPGAEGVRVILYSDANSKALLRVIQETPGATTTVDYDYRPVALTSIYDFGVPRNTTKYIDNMPSAQTRAFLDQLDARVDKDMGDSIAVIVTDPQSLGARGERLGHDRAQPYTVEIFARSGAGFLYRVHSLQQAPATNIDQLLTALKDQPATSYVVYDGRTLSQLTYDPETGKPAASEREVKLEAKDFAASNFPRRIFLGRDFLGSAIPVTRTELISDPRRPGQQGVKITRPTTLYYQDEKNQTASAQATQLSVYWVDTAHGLSPVEYYERRDTPGQNNLKAEVLSTRFAAPVGAPDGGSIPTRWETSTWDVRGMATVNQFNLLAAFNKRLDASWFTKPAVAAPEPDNGAPPLPPR